MGRKLTYTFDETGDYSTVSVEPIGHDSFDGRTEYRWTVTIGQDVRESHSGKDIGGPHGEPLAHALGSVFSFLIAFAEARQSGTCQSYNWNLFPDALAEWATLMSDELTMAQLEIVGER